MKAVIPLTGTVLVERPSLQGDPDDSVRIIRLDLGNVSWTMVSIDLDNDVMVIEVIPSEKITIQALDDEGEPVFDGEGEPVLIYVEPTQTEKQAALKYVKDLLKDHTKDELYQMSGSSRLKKPFKGT